MWKFQDLSAIQILREINFGHFEASKTAIWTIWAALNFEFLRTDDILKCENFLNIKIQSLQIVKMAIFDQLEPAKIDFTWNQSGWKIA